MFQFFLHLLIATLVVAQRPSAGGRGRGNVSPREDEWPKCMRGIRPEIKQASAMKLCRQKTAAAVKDLFQKYKKSGPTNQMIEELKVVKAETFADCMVENMGYAAADGSLNVEMILDEINKMKSADFKKPKHMKIFARWCTANITGTNATEQYINLSNCIRESATEYCDSQRMFMAAYLDRENSASQCAPVNLPTDLFQVMADCTKEITARKATDNAQEGSSTPQDSGRTRDGQRANGSNKFDRRRDQRQRNGGSRRGSGQNNRANRDRKNEVEFQIELQKCFGTKMGFYDPETGFDNIIYSNFIANLTGWEEIPEVLSNVSAILESCQTPYDGDLVVQGLEYKMCIMPDILDICGFENNVTRLIFPGLEPRLGKAAMGYVLEIIGFKGDLNDGDESMEDNSSEESGKGNGGRRPRPKRAEDSEQSEEEEESRESEESVNTISPPILP